MDFRGSDRFSDLPDSILCHILSFLPTKDAVKTSLLSTRLEGVFLHLRKVHLNHNVHPQMVPFINQLLSSSEVGPLTDFVLESESLPQFHVMVSWLNALLLRRVKVVHVSNLSACDYNHIDLPRELFMSDTLEDLEVCGRGFRVFFPKVANCPSLKVLHLKCDVGTYYLGNFSGDLRFGDEAYPMLEDLELEFRYSIRGLKIDLSTLRRLRFTISRLDFYSDRNIEIYTPQLQSLDFIVPHVCEGRKRDVPLIDEIRFRKCQSLLSAVIWYFRLPGVFMSVLYSMSNVKKLHFIECVQLGSNYLFADLLQFPNLTHLKLTNAYSESVWFFLKRAPNLEIFDGGCVSDFLNSEDSYLLPKSLREVRLRGLFWNEDEDDVIKEKDCVVEVASFFLQHGALLESLIIEYPQNMAPGWPLSTLKHLNEVDRFSTECVIELKEEEKE